MNQSYSKRIVLEKRLLLDAAMAAEFVQTIHDPDLNNSQTSNEVVIIDSNIEELDKLVSHFKDIPNIHILNNTDDGIEQITNILQSYNNIDSLNIISHATFGQVALGKSVLSTDTLNEYTDQLVDWSEAFSNHGDINFYGCAFGKGSEDFLSKISELTQTDIAASQDFTGLGGNWDLEIVIGDVEQSYIQELLENSNYQSILAANNAPVYNSGVPLTIDINGQDIASILATGIGGDPITDIDPGAKEGIAIVQIDNTEGLWQYSLDNGQTYRNISLLRTVITLDKALLLDTANFIRFVPAPGAAGSTFLDLRAWDQSDGLPPGTFTKITATGGMTSFSVNTGETLLSFGGRGAEAGVGINILPDTFDDDSQSETDLFDSDGDNATSNRFIIVGGDKVSELTLANVNLQTLPVSSPFAPSSQIRIQNDPNRFQDFLGFTPDVHDGDDEEEDQEKEEKKKNNAEEEVIQESDPEKITMKNNQEDHQIILSRKNEDIKKLWLSFEEQLKEGRQYDQNILETFFNHLEIA